MLLNPSPLRNIMLAMIRPQGERLGETLSLAEQIALQVAVEIVEDETPPLTRITEASIASRFKVSRGPVRDALRMLDATGLIRHLPRRGAVVTELSAEEVADLFELRAVLFGLGARRFAQNRTDDELIEVRRRLADLKHLASRKDERAGADYVLAVLEFGNMICISAGIERLSSMVSNLFLRSIRYSRLGLAQPGRRRESLANWTAMVKHIEARNSEGAEQAARTLVSQSGAEAAKQLNETS